MKRISRGVRVDTLKSEQRRNRSGKIGKYIYIVLLCSFLLLLFDLFFGALFYLSSDGMILRKTVVLSAGYTGVVQDVGVVEGDVAQAGEVIVQISSLDLEAKITANSIDLQMLRSEFAKSELRRDTVRALIPLAEERVENLSELVSNTQKLRSDGLALVQRENDYQDDLYAAKRELTSLKQELEQLNSQIPLQRQRAEGAADMQNRMVNNYANGEIVAPRSGTVGELSTNIGQVMMLGDQLLKIFHGEQFVLAYAPPGRLFDLSSGDQVLLRSGFRVVEGEVIKFFPIAPKVPAEFSLAFDTTDRKQLFRIALRDELPVSMPLFSKVKVTRPWAPLPLVLKELKDLQVLIGGVLFGKKEYL